MRQRAAGQQWARSSPSPQKKMSAAWSPSPRVKAVDGAKLPRSLSTREPLKKPPVAPPSQALTITGTSDDSSPAVSLDPSPRVISPSLRLSSPAPATHQRDDKQEKERVRVFVRMRPMRAGEGEATIRQDVRMRLSSNARPSCRPATLFYARAHAHERCSLITIHSTHPWVRLLPCDAGRGPEAVALG